MDNLLLGLLIILIIVVLVLQLRRPGQEAQMAVLAEKLSHLEPVIQDVNSIKLGLTELKPITQVVNSIQLGVTELKTYAKARQDLERQIAESIRQLEHIIAGTQSKGKAGQNIVEVVFAKLPIDWQRRNFQVGNRTVEFGLNLPNNLVLPIDSKWPATDLLRELTTCDDPNERQRLKVKIEAAVLNKAREVKKYVDPNVTVNFAVAVVPDAVYDLCSGVQADVFQLNVVLVSYSMFVPYLLLVFQTMLKASQSIDLQKLDMYLDTVQESITALQGEIEGRFAKAVAMLNNSRQDMSGYLSKISGGLTSLRIGAPRPTPAALTEPKSLEEATAPVGIGVAGEEGELVAVPGEGPAAAIEIEAEEEAEELAEAALEEEAVAPIGVKIEQAEEREARPIRKKKSPRRPRAEVVEELEEINERYPGVRLR